MKRLLAVCLIAVAAPAFGDGFIDSLCPDPGLLNPWAPECDRIPIAWSVLVDDAGIDHETGKLKSEEARLAEIGYFTDLLRADLKRCKRGPEFVGETEESLRKYEQAYRRAVKRALKERAKSQKK